MIIRATTSTRDFIFGNGKHSYLSGEAAIEANVQSSLLEFVGDCFFNTGAGIDWINRMGNPGQEQNLISDIKILILNCYGVISVNSLTMQVNPNTRKMTISVQITTIYSASAELITIVPIIGNPPSGSPNA